MSIYYYCLLFLLRIESTKSNDYLDDHDILHGLRNHSLHSLENEFSYIPDNRFGSNPDYVTFGTSSIILSELKLQEQLQNFNRERIPERVVHGRGSTAFGYFRVTNPEISKYSKAAVFAHPGKITPAAIRFSTATGESGEADTAFGDLRGFACKFYTEEGNWDMVGNDVPIFPIRDPQQFSSFIHANKRNPKTGLRDMNTVWDFFSLRPETLNIVTYLFSPFNIPNGFRHMPGFSINAYKFVNEQNQYVYVKFHLLPAQGEDYLDVDTAAYIRGADPDYMRRDLFTAIASGNYPSWVMKVQIMTEEEVQQLDFWAFDATKYWPEDRFPLIEVGVITLDTNPKNFFAQNEQIAFCPANLVPGIETSPDKLLHGRLFSYSDAHRYRLGVNHHLIPVNRALNTVITPTQRDGRMRVDNNLGGLPNYVPSSFSTVRTDPQFNEAPFVVNKSIVFRWDTSNDQNFIQPRQLYRNYPQKYRDVLHRSIAIGLRDVYEYIAERMINLLNKVDPNYGESVKIELAKLKSVYHS